MRKMTRIQRQEAWLKLRYLGLKNYPLLQHVDPGHYRAILLRICYSPDFNFLYSRIPKAANSTVVSTLAIHMGMPEGQSEEDFKQKLNQFPTPHQIGLAYKFCVVRDPTLRALSAYLDKVAYPDGYHTKLFDLGEDNTFEGYLKVLKQKDFLRNGHFLPQIRMLPLPIAAYDTVARVESLDVDLEKICHAIFGRFDGQTRVDRHRTGSTSLMDKHLTPAAKALLVDLYRQDYEALEYPMPV